MTGERKDEERTQGAERWYVAAAVALVLVALAVRIAVAVHAYPIPMDGAHFVQFATELAEGNPNGLSAHWSQAPILIAAAGYRLGLDPSRVLQGCSVFMGTVAVLALLLLVRELFNRRSLALLVGVLAVSNPALIEYSVISTAEISFVALLLLSTYVVVRGCRRNQWGVAVVVLPSLLLGLGIYYRAVEAIVYFFLLMIYLAIHMFHRLPRRAALLRLVLAVAIFVAAVLPLWLYTMQRTVYVGPGSKMVNIAFGQYGYDSKAIYGLNGPLEEETRYFEEVGLLKYMWTRRANFVKSYVGNAAQAFRLLNGHLFAGGLRLGAVWFGLAILGGMICLGRVGNVWDVVWLAVLAFAIPAMVCISFVVPRWLVVSVPFLLVFVAAMVDRLFALAGHRRWYILLAVLLLVLTGKNLAYASEHFGDPWYGDNTRKAATVLRQYGDDGDMLMSLHPQFAVHFYEKKPLRTVKLPYGEIVEVEGYAADKNVTLIVIRSSEYPHWPIHALFGEAEPPSNWRLLERVTCERQNKRYGYEKHEFLLYRRSDADTSP